MTAQLSPAFHAEIILELYREFGCYQTVSQRAGVLLHTASPEQLEEIGRHLQMIYSASFHSTNLDVR